MMWFVIDPNDDGECHGKYGMRESNIPTDWENIVSVEKEELSNYEVVSWRYE